MHVPQSEASESYDLEIMSGGVALRTVAGLTTPTFTYSAAMQIADFGGPVTTFSIRLYQIGALGRGVPLVETLTISES